MKNKIKKFVKDNKTNLIITTVVLIIVIVICALYLLVNNYFIKSNSNTNNTNRKIELKYTKTNTEKSKGIVITDVSEVVENVMPSIVAITSKTQISSGDYGPSYFGREQYAEGAGSGIIISKSDEDLMILTNNHVIENASELSVQFINEKSFDAKIVGTSDKKDVAVISVPLENIDNETLESIKIATMGDSNKLKVGNGIIAIGNALGYGQSVTTGVVSAIDREVEVDDYTNNMIQIDAAINGGNSGGALLNSKGEVIGINSLKYSSSATSSNASIEGMGFAIPISNINDLITSLMNGEGDNSATIGIEGRIITNSYKEIYNIPTGFYITGIEEKSGADNANLEIGNIVTKINGKEITSTNDINNSMKNIYKNWDEKMFNDYLKEFSLLPNKQIKTFSKGMRKKLEIITAISHHPKLLILDEPTSGLDPVARTEITNIFQKFIENDNCSIFLSSHITTDLERIADYITFINNGKIILSKTTNELLDNYGIVRCTEKEFKKIDKKDYITYKREKYSYDVLVENKKDFKEKYNIKVIDKITLDDLMVLMIKGEK